MPNINDKFNQATTNGRPSPAALVSVKTIGATSITVDSTTEWPTDTAVHFIIYEVDANNDKIEGTQCDFKGVVNSATTINNLTLKAGTDREYSIGSKVICAPTAAWADDVVEGIVVSLNQDGTLKKTAVDTALGNWTNWTPTVTASGSMTISSLSVDYARYKIIGKTLNYYVRLAFTTGGTASNSITFTLPGGITLHVGSAVTTGGNGWSGDPGAEALLGWTNNGNSILTRKYNSSNWSIGSSRFLHMQGVLEIE